jgi:hypothetical protein
VDPIAGEERVMVQVTEYAATKLQGIKEESGLEPSEGIKLIPDGNAVDVAVGEPDAGDEVIERGEQPLLIVDARLIVPLRDYILDCEDVEVDGTVEDRFLLRAA